MSLQRVSSLRWNSWIANDGHYLGLVESPASVRRDEWGRQPFRMITFSEGTPDFHLFPEFFWEMKNLCISGVIDIFNPVAF